MIRSKVCLVICAAFLFTACQQKGAITDRKHIEQNKKILKSCIDSPDFCVGGFIKEAGTKKITEIRDGEICGDEKEKIEFCDEQLLIDWGLIVTRRVRLENNLEWIALPSNIPLWSKAAQLYGYQFVKYHPN